MLRWSVSLSVVCVLAGSVSGQSAQTAPASPTLRLVSSIDVKDFGAETARFGDLDGDGAIDVLLVQSIYLTREITCLTALTTEGRVLWRSGKASADNGRIYSDLPVQVWTVNREADMTRLLAWGADAIVTDRPDVAARIVRLGP